MELMLLMSEDQVMHGQPNECQDLGLVQDTLYVTVKSSGPKIREI